jgi:hypothetical protein
MRIFVFGSSSTLIICKEHMTVDMKSINWDALRYFNIPVVNEAIDICHAKGMISIMAMNCDWNEEVIAQFYANLHVRREAKTFHGSCKASPSWSLMRGSLKFLALVRRILGILRYMVERFP